jgi:hypothetical protein
MPDIVIAPDLSNLPKGAHAVDSETSEIESRDNEADETQTGETQQGP